MNKLSFSFAALSILFICFASPLAAYDTDSEDQRIVIDKIISTHMDEETKQIVINLREASYPVLRNIKVYDKNKRKCRLNYLRLPFMARIVMVKYEENKWAVIEIRPHEE